MLYSQLQLVLLGNLNDKNTKFIAIAPISSKTGKQWRNKGSTELYCLFIAAEIVVIRHIVLWSKEVLPKSSSGFLNPARSGSGQIWSSQIQYNPVYNCDCYLGYYCAINSCAVYGVAM